MIWPQWARLIAITDWSNLLEGFKLEGSHTYVLAQDL